MATRALKNVRIDYTNKPEDFAYFFGFSTGPSGHAIATEFLPAVKLKHILAKILNAQGYELIWEIDNHYPLEQADFTGRERYEAISCQTWRLLAQAQSI